MPWSRSQKLIAVGAVFVVLFGLRYMEALLTPLLVAALIVALSSPLSALVSRRGFPPVVGALAVLLVDFAGLAVFGVILLLAARDVQDKLPLYIPRLSSAVNVIAYKLSSHHVPISSGAIVSALHMDQMGPVLGEAVTRIASLASNGAVVLLLVFFTLCELGDFGARLRRLRSGSLGFERLDRIARQIQKYLIVKTLTSFLVSLLVFVTLKLFHVELALLLAVLMFALHYVPNVGPVIATIPALLVAYFDRGMGVAAMVGVIVTVVTFIVGNVVEPRVLGKTLGISPLVVLLGILFWGWLWGPVGALLSVPLMMVMKVTLENIPDLAWLAELTDPAPDTVQSRARRIVTGPLKRMSSNPDAPEKLGPNVKASQAHQRT